MSNVALVVVFISALLCSAVAYRAIDAPQSKNGMIVLHWRVLAKGLAGGGAFVGAVLLGIVLMGAFR